MKNAYTALGILIILVIGGAYLGFRISNKPDSLLYITPSSLQNKMTIESSAFPQGGKIPPHYTCNGEGINPPLAISHVPVEAKSLVLFVSDPDIPESIKQSRGITEFVHWVAFNIPSSTSIIEEGADAPGVLGNNGAGKPGYIGPCPPDREHRYFFRLYALDSMLDLAQGAAKADIEKAMMGHVLEEAELIGKYEQVK